MLKVRIAWGAEPHASVEIPTTMLKPSKMMDVEKGGESISTTFIRALDPTKPRSTVLPLLRETVLNRGGIDLFECEFVVVHEYPMPPEASTSSSMTSDEMLEAIAEGKIDINSLPVSYPDESKLED